MNNRANKTGLGTHEYRQDGYVITLMANDLWSIFEQTLSGTLYEVDTPDFKTLTAARKWLKANAERMLDEAIAKREAYEDYGWDNIAENH